MIQEELAAMIQADNFKHPIKGMKEVKRPPSNYFEINPHYMDRARSLILEECSSTGNGLDLYPVY